MSKHDLQARPVYHDKRDSIEAHLSIVSAALTLSHWIEHQTGWSIKKFVRTTRRYRTVQIRPDDKPSPRPTPYPPTSATPSPKSTHPTVRTNLAEVRFQFSHSTTSASGRRGVAGSGSALTGAQPTRNSIWGKPLTPKTSI